MINFERTGRKGVINLYSSPYYHCWLRLVEPGQFSLQDYMIIRTTRENYARHRLSRSLADIHGIDAAILLTDLAQNIHQIADYRKTNQGWYYVTIEELCKRHPYISRSTIVRTLNKLKKEEIIKTGRFSRKRYDRTTWYAFVDNDDFQMALNKNDNLTFIVNDAVKYGPQAAIILSNIKYNIGVDSTLDVNYLYEFQRISPAKLADDCIVNLPMTPRIIRGALKKLVEGGALERKRSNVKGDASYLYRLAESESRFLALTQDDLPTEAYLNANLSDLHSINTSSPTPSLSKMIPNPSSSVRIGSSASSRLTPSSLEQPSPTLPRAISGSLLRVYASSHSPVAEFEPVLSIEPSLTAPIFRPRPIYRITVNENGK